MDRREELRMFAERLGDLEKEFQVVIMSENGIKNAMVEDKKCGNLYEYYRGAGLMKPSWDDTHHVYDPEEYL